MVELFALGVQIEPVVLVGRDHERLPPGDGEAVPLQPDDLAGIVGEETDAGQTELLEDLRAESVVAQVGAKPSWTLASTVSSPCSCRW